MAVRLEESSDGVQVIIGAPGVKQEDFDVVQGDHTLHVKGETAHGTDVFCVDRHIVLSRQVDLDTALCTHSNGVLTITLKRKEGKRIPVKAVTARTRRRKASGLSPSRRLAPRTTSERRAGQQRPSTMWPRESTQDVLAGVKLVPG